MQLQEKSGMARQLRVAMFSSLRAEIGTRTSAQHTLLSLNVTASGVIAGLVYGSQGQPEILLGFPVLSVLLGALYIDHAYAINRLDRRAWKIYDTAVDPDVPERLVGEPSRGYHLFFRVLVLCIFFVVPLWAIVQGWYWLWNDAFHHTAYRIALIFEVALLLGVAIGWWYVSRHQHLSKSAHEKRESEDSSVSRS